jgi:hypothetical protein
MSNSSLVVYTKISPNKTVNRKYAIDRISPHCVVGQVTAERLGQIFEPESREASSNYGIDKDGRVGMYVEEKDRSWCTSSSDNDHRAVTIECASDTKHPYIMKDVVYEKLIELCVDICKRNGKTKLLWIADKTRALNYKLANDEMLIAVHRWFANKSCPGDWLYERLGDLAAKVTTRLKPVIIDTQDEEPDEEVKSATKYYVQVGAFSQLKNAEDMAVKLKTAGFNAVIKTSENEVITEKEWEPEVGDIVRFMGYKQYSNANSDTTHGAIAGVAKITAIAKGKKHPYHLVRTGNAGPYGWVDAGTFTKV